LGPNLAKFGTGLFLLDFMARFGVFEEFIGWFRLVPPFSVYISTLYISIPLDYWYALFVFISYYFPLI